MNGDRFSLGGGFSIGPSRTTYNIHGEALEHLPADANPLFYEAYRPESGGVAVTADLELYYRLTPKDDTVEAGLLGSLGALLANSDQARLYAIPRAGGYVRLLDIFEINMQAGMATRADAISKPGLALQFEGALVYKGNNTPHVKVGLVVQHLSSGGPGEEVQIRYDRTTYLGSECNDDYCVDTYELGTEGGSFRQDGDRRIYVGPKITLLW